MKAFTALQHVLSALFIFVMATFWALPIVPALWVFHEVNAFGADATEWMGYLFTSIAAALAFIAWGLCLLLLSGTVQMIIHPRVPAEGKVVPLFSGTTIRWAACGVIHRATKPFLIHVCPSIFANTYYRLAGVKLGQDSNLTSQDINDPFLVRVGSDTVIGGHAAINGHMEVVTALLAAGADINLQDEVRNCWLRRVRVRGRERGRGVICMQICMGVCEHRIFF